MFQLIKDNTVTLCANPNWVALQDNGCYGLVHMQDATGIVCGGTVYHIEGREPIDAETVTVRDVSGIQSRINSIEEILRSDYDYIGVKIAQGRAKLEDYAEKIAQADAYGNEIAELRRLLNDPEGALP